MEEKKIIGLEGPAGKTDKADSLTERKTHLKRQADFYRVGIVHAKHSIKQGARPEDLFHSALDHATWAVRSRVDGILRPTGVSVATVWPYALSILRLLRQRRMVKPALGVLAAVAGAAVYFQRRRTHAGY